MSTFVAFAGNLAKEPELLYTQDDKPFISCRVLVSRRVTHDVGEWVDAEPTAHNVKIYGTFANHVHDSAGRGTPIAVQGVGQTETWTDMETGRKRTRDDVVVDHRFGNVAVSLRRNSVRLERVAPAADAAN
ncbi:single-stranded DNA-binding protein [Nocardioides immobilis]|nr:single-stranded DNA-binding protein [Nocardioides immobilis]